MIHSKVLWGVALLFSCMPAFQAGLTCGSNKWLDSSKSCCIDSGLCSSSSCTVFGFKNSARTNCHTADTNPNCKGSYCSWAGSPACVPTAGRQVHCYGTVKCSDGSTQCDGYGMQCLDDGISANFKICGDDSCPTRLDGTCACPCGQERNETLGDCADIPYGPRKPCCGGCGPGAVCHDGLCECECGRKNTVGTIQDGCEASDAVCCPGNPICGPNSYCENGQCFCKCGFKDTNGDKDAGAGSNGCETPVTNVCCNGCPPERVCSDGQCVCEDGLVEPDCKPPVTCEVTAVVGTTITDLSVDSSPQSLMLWRPGPEIQKGRGKGSNKGVDQAIGDFTINYVESSKTFTLTFNLNNLDAWGFPTSFLRFKKVWPRLRFKQQSVKFDTKWLREYSSDSNATYVRYEGIQVPDFICDRPGPKDLYLWTQLQYWVPNHGVKLGPDGLPLDPTKINFRAAHGYIQDGLSKTGRQRREYIVTVMCGGMNVDYIVSGNCSCNPACTNANEFCDIHSGQPKCECKDGFQRDPTTNECLPDSCSDLAPYCPDNSYCLERGVGNGPICKCNPGFHPINAADNTMQCVRKCVFNGATGLKAVGSGGIIGKLKIEINDNSGLESPEVAFNWTLTDGQIRRISAQASKEQWMTKHVPLMYNIQSILAAGAGTYRYPPLGYIALGQGPIDCSPSADNIFYISSQLGYVTSTGASGKGHSRGRKSGYEESMSFEFRVKCLPNCPVAEKCHNCHNLAECVWDSASSEDNKYKCKCSAGYKGNGVMGVSTDGCFDEDECAVGAATACGANTACTNSAGSYTCACSTNKLNEDPKGGCCTSGVSGCPTGMTLRDVVVEATPASDTPAESCTIPAWVWITLGVLVTALLVVSCALIVQRVMFRHEIPLIQVAGSERQPESAPAPSVASNFQSPSVRHRVTPSGRGAEPKNNYNPMQE